MEKHPLVPIPVQGWAILETRRLCPICAELRRLLPYADLGKGTENAKNVQEPQDNANDHDGVQDRLNGTRHWYESINKPENNTNDDQDHHYLN
jgi:hypothetical protein